MINLRDIHKPLSSRGALSFGLLNTRRMVETYPVDLNPDWQRGHVWTPQQQGLFVGHLLEGGEVLPLVVNEGPNGDLIPTQIIDGKQRMTAAMAWADGEVAAELGDGRKIRVGDLDDVGRTQCSVSIGLRYAMVRLTRRECLELYIRLNRGGTVHTDAEIDRVRKLLEVEERT